MDLLHLIAGNILSPAILFFALGILAGFVKSDLEVPDSISRYLSIYLMMAIGLKGGVAIANTDEFTGQIIAAIGAGLLISLLLPFVAYGILRATTNLDRPTAAAVAAHYGSISMVTFATATAFLKANSIEYAGYVVAILALMEAPAILSGLFDCTPHHARNQNTREGRKETQPRDFHQRRDPVALWGICHRLDYGAAWYG